MKWSVEQLAILYDRYADEDVDTLSAATGRSTQAVNKMAANLGLKKSDQFLKRQQMENVKRLADAHNRKRLIQEKTILSDGEKRIHSGIVSKAGNITVHRMV